MKIIEHFYGADLNWTDSLAEQLEGKVDGNFIIVPDRVSTGSRYFFDCGEGIVAFYIDVINNCDLLLLQRNLSDDFVGIYYNLTEGEVKYSSDSFDHVVGRWQYNFLVIDSSLETDYFIKANSSSFILCIFLKKSMIAAFAAKHGVTFKNLDKITNSKKNTMIRFDIMSNESYHALNDLRKLEVGGDVFDYNLVGTVHLLLSNYFKKMNNKRIILQTVNRSDLASIIEIETFLMNNLENVFPTIKVLASMANMSESKFKSLFKKIIGKTANTFFMENKVIKGKELLEKDYMSISKVADKLNFANSSHFALKFKKHYGLTPKVFVKEL